MLPSNQTFSGALQQKGVDRRRFIKFCIAMTATLALPPRYVAQVAAALEKARKPVLVWLQFQDCAGNSESILRLALFCGTGRISSRSLAFLPGNASFMAR